MRKGIFFYQSKYIWISESTIFFPLVIILGSPMVLGINLWMNFKIPAWSNACFVILCDPSWQTYKTQVKHTAAVLFYASVCCIIGLLLTDNNLGRCLIALLCYTVYRLDHTGKIQPYTFGLVNIALITASSFMGIVDQPLDKAFVKIGLVGMQTLIAFACSYIFMGCYYLLKSLFLRIKHALQ